MKRLGSIRRFCRAFCDDSPGGYWANLARGAGTSQRLILWILAVGAERGRTPKGRSPVWGQLIGHLVVLKVVSSGALNVRESLEFGVKV